VKYTEPEIQNARDMSLVDYISSNENWTIVHVGNFYTTKEHDSLRIMKDEKTFFWNSRGINGKNVIDWLMKTRHLTFVQALEEILGRKAETEVEKPKIKEEVKKIQLPCRASDNALAYEYLTKVRCLDENIFQYIFNENIAYQDTYGNAVFIGCDAENNIRFAESHTTGTAANVKPKNIIGSDKKYSFHINSDSDILYVFEAPIDLLSHASIYLLKCGNAFSVNRLSLSGANSKVALDGYLERYSHIKNIVFALDSDNAGVENAMKYFQNYSKLGFNCKIIMPPECFKDWNEYLQNLMTKNQEDIKQEIENFSETEFIVPNDSDKSETGNRKLNTISMSELYECVYNKKPPVIDNLLYPGTYLFVGAPKLGKSFMMAQISYHVSTGTPLWNYAVRQGTVLYLALEDDYCRLQERLYRMFGVESTDKLHFATSAEQLNCGLEEQIINFLKEHSDTNLIIIDTLQKVREVENEAYSYANDYEVITKLKKIADEYGFCLLLVHHTRKQQSNDKFDMISGTNGLLGAADGAFLLHKEKRTSKSAVLEISGRDQQDQKLTIKRNTEKLLWELEKAETELWKEPPEPLLEAVGKVVNESNPTWEGTATELLEKLDLDFEIQANALTKRLNVNSSRLYNEWYINYTTKRTHSGRMIYLSYDENHPILIQPETDTASPESDTDTKEECKYMPYKDDPSISYFEIKGEGNNKSFEEMTPEEKKNFILTSY